MVKFNLDSLKKMGSDLMNQAKNVDVTGMMDKIKNKVETVSSKFTGEKSAIEKVNSGLTQLSELQPNEAEAIKKIQADFASIQARIEAVLAAQAAEIARKQEEARQAQAAEKARKAEEARVAQEAEKARKAEEVGKTEAVKQTQSTPAQSTQGQATVTPTEPPTQPPIPDTNSTEDKQS